MSETITLEDGTEREVMTDEEIKDLKSKAETSESLSKQYDTLKQELGIKDGENFEDKIKELKESSNPNWQEARKKISTLESVVKQLKTEGKEIADDGTIKVAEERMTKDEVAKTSEATTRKVLFDTEKSRILAKYDEKTKAVVEHYLNKLMTGEEQNIDNLYKFSSEAEKLANPNSTSNPLNRFGQRPLHSYPNNGMKPEQNDWAATEEGKSAGSAMGLSSFNQSKK